MREIKFRGKFLDDTSEWIYGNYFYIEKDIFSHKIIDNKGLILDIKADTLGEYTGLHDKNGKEIYEGDICLYIGSDGKGDISYPYCGEQRSFVGEKVVIDSYQSMIIGRHISTYKESINFSAPNGIINGWEIIKPYDLWNHQSWIQVIRKHI